MIVFQLFRWCYRCEVERAEGDKYGPTRGCPDCQTVVNGAIPLRIAATCIDECRERVEKLMIQDPEGSDRVVRTRVRPDEAPARHVEEYDERARQMAKHGHHETGPNRRQSSSPSSSGVIRPREEPKRDNQDDLKMNEDDG